MTRSSTPRSSTSGRRRVGHTHLRAGAGAGLRGAGPPRKLPARCRAHGGAGRSRCGDRAGRPGDLRSRGRSCSTTWTGSSPSATTTSTSSSAPGPTSTTTASGSSSSSPSTSCGPPSRWWRSCWSPWTPSTWPSPTARASSRPGTCWSTCSPRRGWSASIPSGKPFDPNEADAVAHEDGDGGPVVAEVLRPGYRWKGRVIRPAMVKVRGLGAHHGPAAGVVRKGLLQGARGAAVGHRHRNPPRLPEAGQGEPPRRQSRQGGAVQGDLGGLRRPLRAGQAQGVRRDPPARPHGRRRLPGRRGRRRRRRLGVQRPHREPRRHLRRHPGPLRRRRGRRRSRPAGSHTRAAGRRRRGRAAPVVPRRPQRRHHHRQRHHRGVVQHLLAAPAPPRARRRRCARAAGGAASRPTIRACSPSAGPAPSARGGA